MVQTVVGRSVALMEQHDIVDKDQIKHGGAIQPLSPIGSPSVRETAGSLSPLGPLSFRGFVGISSKPLSSYLTTLSVFKISQNLENSQR